MTDLLWNAPAASHPLAAVVDVPGSKSVTNRALVLAALADSPALVRRPLKARDTRLMSRGLTALGAPVLDQGDDWLVSPARSGTLTGDVDIDCGLAGTVMRFLPACAGLARGDVRFDGDAAARVRPMGVVLEALRVLGVEVSGHGGTLPFTIQGTGRVRGGEVTVDASGSSQFISGLLLCAPRFDDGVVVRHQGPRVPSLPHIAMTVHMLREAGVDVDDSTPDVWIVNPGLVKGRDVDVEPDLSSAAPFLAAALVTGGRVTIPGWPAQTTQPGDALRGLLTRMGATVTLSDTGLELTSTGAVHGLDADLHDVGELTPVLAAVAAVADGPSRLRGIAHLRGHESDRLAALATELTALGCGVVESHDALQITPKPLHGGVFATYEDHRMAMAGAVLGLVVPGVRVADVATTSKTLPDFVGMWDRMLGTAPAARDEH